MESQIPKPKPTRFESIIVSTTDSPELSHLRWALRHSSVVALDAEWKPTRTRRTEAGSKPAPEPAPALSFPTVTLLQIACRVEREESDREREGSPVFLVDLMAVPLESIWEILSEMFVSPSVLKLGFRFKQDLVYLSSTFAAQGGFDRFTNYDAGANGPERTFSAYTADTNSGEESFAGYGKGGNGVPTTFKSYSDTEKNQNGLLRDISTNT